MNVTQTPDYLNELHDCALCPHECHADRFSPALGTCKSDASFLISSICIHRGEEPVISGPEGICNIFFAHCNLQCIYCQNHQISDNHQPLEPFRMELPEIVKQVTAILDTGINMVGFVSPSHSIPQMKAIMAALKDAGYSPVWVYNTNGYDKAETLRTLEGLIDVYLPDFKYSDEQLGLEYSGIKNYPETALKAIKEMYRQKGAALHVSDNGTAQSGIIIRHLVLPGQVENSVGVIKTIGEELSPKLHISLMSQYFPTRKVKYHPMLGRTIRKKEYAAVLNEMERQGMHHGWIQEFDNSGHYRPDFDRGHPFE